MPIKDIRVALADVEKPPFPEHDPSYTPSIESLDALRERKLVKSSSHPTLPLSIWNYTFSCQYKKYWTPDTLHARGLVLDHTSGNVVARPMIKIFNFKEGEASIQLARMSDEERQQMRVFDKLDGSLGLWFHHRGFWVMASRGSFTSEHAIVAEKIAREKKLDRHGACNPGKTYTFEIISPQLKLTVDYGLRRDLVLLAVIDTVTGEEEAPEPIAKSLGLSTPEELMIGSNTTLEELKANDVIGKEGYVVKWETGIRIKVKFANYLDANVSELKGDAAEPKRKGKKLQSWQQALYKKICLGMDLEGILDGIPDEAHDEVRKVDSILGDRVRRYRNRLDKLVSDFGFRRIADMTAYLATHPASTCDCCQDESPERKCPTITAPMMRRLVGEKRRVDGKGKTATKRWEQLVDNTVYDVFKDVDFGKWGL